MNTLLVVGLIAAAAAAIAIFWFTPVGIATWLDRLRSRFSRPADLIPAADPRQPNLIDNSAAPAMRPASGIDYRDPKYNVPPNGAVFTDLEMMHHIMKWIHGSGMPVGWDWSEWERATGRKVPQVVTPDGSGIDRSGSDLGVGGGHVLVNKFTPGEARVFSFAVIPGFRKINLDVMGPAVQWITWSIPGHFPEQRVEKFLNAKLELIDQLPSGRHAFVLAIERGDGGTEPVDVGVQFNQWQSP